MLGVQVDTSRAQQGEIAMGRTAERKLELGQALEETLSSTKMAERLRGRMVFYECFAAGRTTNLLLKNFGNLCRSQRFVEDLTEDECDLILALRNRVEKAEPIVISPKLLETWLVFTDGACETCDTGGKLGGVGGVLVSANGTYLQHFGMQVPEDWMQILLQHSSHPVHEPECCPSSSPFMFGPTSCVGSQVLHYTDNDSCRFALMKGSEKPLSLDALSSPQSWTVNMPFQTKSWYGRVPSHSNPSDDPNC